jgi:hypothetical protein
LETWKEILNHPEYSISNYGNVMKGKQTIYPRMKLDNGIQKGLIISIGRKTVHIGKQVALNFCSNPENHKQFIYIDRNKNNIKSENLKWVDGYTYMIYSLNDPACYPKQKHLLNRTEQINHLETQMSYSIKLLRYLKTGNNKYLEIIINELKPNLIKYLIGLTKSKRIAEEVFFDASYYFLDAIERGICHTVNLEQYFKTTAKNEYLKSKLNAIGSIEYSKDLQTSEPYEILPAFQN